MNISKAGIFDLQGKRRPGMQFIFRYCVYNGAKFVFSSCVLQLMSHLKVLRLHFKRVEMFE